jgi:endonuclease YncB( thermonuclease family)
MKAIGLVLGGAGLLAAGAAAAYFIAVPHPPPPAAAAKEAPATEPAAAPAASPAPQEHVALSPQEAFVPLVQRFSLIRDSAAYEAPSQSAPQFYPLRSGTPLISTARSPDGTWTVAMTADGRAAFLPTADLGPYDPSRIPQPPLPQTIAGRPQVIDTATLTIDGQDLVLDGLAGLKDPWAARMQDYLDHAGDLSCALQQSGHYICTLPDGQDVGRSAVYNGIANVSADASADYREQAANARFGHRGMWKSAEAGGRQASNPP